MYFITLTLLLADFVDPYLGRWNSDVVAAAGCVARTLYDEWMSSFVASGAGNNDHEILPPTTSSVAGTSRTRSTRTQLVHLQRSFSLGSSSPSARVAQLLTEAFLRGVSADDDEASSAVNMRGPKGRGRNIGRQKRRSLPCPESLLIPTLHHGALSACDVRLPSRGMQEFMPHTPFTLMPKDAALKQTRRNPQSSLSGEVDQASMPSLYQVLQKEGALREVHSILLPKLSSSWKYWCSYARCV
jgi:hypothetical protein